MAIWVTLILVIILGLGGPLLIVWTIVRSTEEAERNPKYRRVLLLGGGALYLMGFLGGVANAIGDAVHHELEWPSLIGLGVVAAMATFFFRAAFAKPQGP